VNPREVDADLLSPNGTRHGAGRLEAIDEDPMSEQNPLHDKDVLTTGDVARICNVASRTVSKWFDSGQLRGYRIPGSKDRRIPLANLLAFMKQHQIPMDGLMSGNPRLLVVDSDRSTCDTLRQVLVEQTRYEVRTASTAFEAGLECERFRPHVMILDLHMEGGDASTVLGMVRSTEELQMTRVIGVSNRLTEAQAMQFSSQGFDGVIRKPFTVRQIVDCVERSYAFAC
jgi:excisionase family DNA binding protein